MNNPKQIKKILICVSFLLEDMKPNQIELFGYNSSQIKLAEEVLKYIRGNNGNI